MSKIKPQIKKNNPSKSNQHWVEHFWCGVLDWRNGAYAIWG
ncbi:hypothetical protein [Helicobacter pylori]|nr:hypothetical protein [Helicobacter pylori]